MIIDRNNPPDMYPGGAYREDGITPLPASEFSSDVVAEDYMPYTIVGLVKRIYYADDEDNIDRLGHQASDLDVFNDKEFEEGPGDANFWRAILKAYRNGGNHLYCDVRSLSIPRGRKAAQAEYKNCLVLPSISGPLDYGITVPSPENNASPDSSTSDGTWCILGFINGDPGAPYILKFFNSPVSGKTPTRQEGKVTKFHFNGCHVDIRKNGDLSIDAKLAGGIPVVNSDTGQASSERGNSLDGEISVSTKSNIKLVAGAGGSGKGAFSQKELAGGSLTLAADKQVLITSKTKTINIFTQRDADTNKVTNPVNIQGAHGGAMRAAREGDTVEIFPSNEGGDIFDYLNNIKLILGATASAMTNVRPEAGVQAAQMAFSLIDGMAPPTSAKGVITSGTPYVYLGGPTTANNVLGPTGVDLTGDDFELNALGVMPDAGTIKDCITEAVENYIAKLAGDIAKRYLLAPIVAALKEAEGYVAANEMGRGGLNIFIPGTAKVLSTASNAVINSLLTGDIAAITSSDQWIEAGMDVGLSNLEAIKKDLDGVDADPDAEPPVEAKDGLYKQLEDVTEPGSDPPEAIPGKEVQFDALTLKIEVVEKEKTTALDYLKGAVEKYSAMVDVLLADPYVALSLKVLPDVLKEDYVSALQTLDKETGNYIGYIVRLCLDKKIDASIADALKGLIPEGAA